MIRSSPESDMPEPYFSYVAERNAAIGQELAEVVGDADVQLCPRAITPEERVFDSDAALVYGTVVYDEQQGYKSVLYEDAFAESSGEQGGIFTTDIDAAVSYATAQFKDGNRVRVKDPYESDSRGQITVAEPDELTDALKELQAEAGIVLMPNLASIQHRLSVGRIALGQHGTFEYVGSEEQVDHGDKLAYGGTDLGLYAAGDHAARAAAGRRIDAPPDLVARGVQALDRYGQLVAEMGRASVDVVQGVTDNGSTVRSVIDITPRVGGATPAEVLAIKELVADERRVCFAASRLLYQPAAVPTTGRNFLQADALIINARVNDVI